MVPYLALGLWGRFSLTHTCSAGKYRSDTFWANVNPFENTFLCKKKKTLLLTQS